MTSSVNDFSRKVTVTDVSSIVVSDIVDDGTETSTWVRSIRVFATPHADNDPPIVELLIKSATKAKLEILAPTQNF